MRKITALLVFLSIAAGVGFCVNQLTRAEVPDFPEYAYTPRPEPGEATEPPPLIDESRPGPTDQSPASAATAGKPRVASNPFATAPGAPPEGLAALPPTDTNRSETPADESIARGEPPAAPLIAPSETTP